MPTVVSSFPVLWRNFVRSSACAFRSLEFEKDRRLVDWRKIRVWVGEAWVADDTAAAALDVPETRPNRALL